MTAVDNSPAMLEHVAGAETVLTDIAALDLGRCFDVVVLASHFVNVTARLEIDPLEERRQVFDEGWRLLRDNFYDEKMHGVDWNAVRAHYRPLVDDCLAREDFYALMSDVPRHLIEVGT